MLQYQNTTAVINTPVGSGVLNMTTYIDENKSHAVFLCRCTISRTM